MSHNSLIEPKIIVNDAEIKEELLIPNSLYIDMGMKTLISFKLHRCIEVMGWLKALKKKNKIKIICNQHKCDETHELFSFNNLILKNKIFDFKKVMIECIFMEKE